MDLLPKVHEGFSYTEYWNIFFKEHSKKSLNTIKIVLELLTILRQFLGHDNDCYNMMLIRSFWI